MEIFVLVVRQTKPRAIQVILDTKAQYGRNMILWLPRSQIECGDDIAAGEREFCLTISEWLWEEKLKEINDASDASLVAAQGREKARRVYSRPG